MIRIPSISNIQTISKMSRTDLVDLLVTGAATAIAASVPGEQSDEALNAMAHDIERAIWARLGTNGSEIFDRHYEACGAIVLALARIGQHFADDPNDTTALVHADAALRRALEHLDPLLAAEAEKADAEEGDLTKLYAERWKGRAT